MPCNTMYCSAIIAMHCNALQCNAVQCNALQCITMYCSAIIAMHCNALPCNAVQCNALSCNAMQCNAMLLSVAGQVNTPTQFVVDLNGVQGQVNAKVVAPSGTESDATLQQTEPGNWVSSLHG